MKQILFAAVVVLFAATAAGADDKKLPRDLFDLGQKVERIESDVETLKKKVAVLEGKKAAKAPDCETCPCPDPKACPADCDRRPAGKMAGDADIYARAYQAAMSGRTIILVVGEKTPVPSLYVEIYKVGSAPGLTPGVYYCYRDNGRMLAKPRETVGCVGGSCPTSPSPAFVPAFGNPFNSCPNGRCPQSR